MNAARILVVEDNAANLELMVYLLHAWGYRTLTATDGATGLEAARGERPDLILCDVRMPVMDGHAFARELRHDASLRTIPLVAVTAFAREADRVEALASGFDGWLPKPIDPEIFVQQIEAFLPAGLRRTASAGAQTHDASGRRPQRNGRTILVLDNVQANLDLAADLLGYSGYAVVTALDAAQALRRARAAPPDLIVSDVCMPEGSGFEFILKVKDDPRLRDIPFVFISSTLATESARRRGLALGAAKYLFRPMEPEELLRQIADCFGEPS